jgi:hypothetical protein
MIGSARAGTTADTHSCEPGSLRAIEVRALASVARRAVFFLDKDLHGGSAVSRVSMHPWLWSGVSPYAGSRQPIVIEGPLT